ncbi:MAG: DUF7847 domain-containing protein [Methanotrichaceae archaeon]
MYEDIGTLIRKGFNTWKHNLNLAVPFVLNVVIIGLLAFITLVLVLSPLMSILPNLATSPAEIEDAEEILGVIEGAVESNLGIVIAGLIIFLLIVFLVNAFFTAGAIGMARGATENGRTSLSDMWIAGKTRCTSLFAAQILVGLLMLAGFVVLSIPFVSTAMNGITTGNLAIGPIAIWVALIIIYGLLISLALVLMPYALVIDDLRPVNAIKTGINFFRSNKMDVFLVWLIIAAISMAVGSVNTIFSGSETAYVVWEALSAIISLVVIAPLSTIWWARFYMTRTRKMTEPEDEEVKYL